MTGREAGFFLLEEKRKLSNIFAWLDSNEKSEKQSRSPRSRRSRPQRNLLQEIGRLQELRVTWTRLLLQELMGFVGLNQYSKGEDFKY